MSFNLVIIGVPVRGVIPKGSRFSIFTKGRSLGLGATAPIMLFAFDRIYVDSLTGEVVLIKRGGRMIWEWGLGSVEDDGVGPSLPAHHSI